MGQYPDAVTNSLRSLPSVDVMLHHLDGKVTEYGHVQVTEALRRELALIRSELLSGASYEGLELLLTERVSSTLRVSNVSSLRPVLNLTGTVLHTNLGRAALSESALAAVVRCAAGSSNLEYDLESGDRGDRDSHVEPLVQALTGAEAATFVNNNAAAVLLVLNTLARNAEVPVSRGELVEIGGSFRIPEVMERSGVKLVEVGATNRTHLKDYAGALSADTAALMKVHTSNYRIEGFTHAVSERALAELAHEHDLPLVVDLGSGSLVDMSAYNLPSEPTVAQIIAEGADIVTFSGDKLLGGPQCGIIAGKRELIQKIRANPLKRALRLDKMTLAALAETLKLYLNPDDLAVHLPALRLLTRSFTDIEAMAKRLLPAVQGSLGDAYQVTVENCQSQIGSGALPIETIASCALVVRPHSGKDEILRELAQALRDLGVPILGRIKDGCMILDLRCLEREAELLEQLVLLKQLKQSQR